MRHIFLVALLTVLFGCHPCKVPTTGVRGGGQQETCETGVYYYTPKIVSDSEFCALYPANCSGDTLDWVNHDQYNILYEDGQFIYSDTQDQFLIYTLDSVYAPPQCQITNVKRIYKAKQLWQQEGYVPNKIRSRIVLGEDYETVLYPMFTSWTWYYEDYPLAPDSSAWTKLKLLNTHWKEHSYSVGGQKADTVWNMIDLIQIEVTLE